MKRLEMMSPKIDGEHSLKILKRHEEVWKVFDALLDIPSVIWVGNLLIVWNNHLALHCNDVLHPV